jgi:hypothetical protein
VFVAENHSHPSLIFEPTQVTPLQYLHFAAMLTDTKPKKYISDKHSSLPGYGVLEDEAPSWLHDAKQNDIQHNHIQGNDI